MNRSNLAFLALALVAAGCLNKADTAKVDAAESHFLGEVQAKQYGLIYDEAAPDLKDSVSRDDFVAMLQRIDAAHGDCKPAVKAFDIHVNANTNGYFTTQGYTSQCANGPLQFQLTTVLRKGVAQVAGYQAGAPAPSTSD